MADKKEYEKMFGKAVVLCSCLLFLGSCASNDGAMPQIVYNPGLAPSPPPRQPIQTKPIRQGTGESVPRGWLPPSSVEKDWSAIIIHHSATQNGNAAIFDKMHREQNHWDGIGYDFLIGNGTDSGDGEVEVTFRWLRQIPGAHTGGTPGNWANEDGIGICLVGNFDQTTPTPQQMQSLAKLVRFLQRRYGIPQGRIFGHGSTPGGHVTRCPGTKFPMSRLKQMLGS
ncbi:MAG TPA: peptidoglycan recognition family protein [Sedimentisphaerales bacterium]|nr:peptidoglycan recognition family protein [Sedimentisphaerales bacterium]